MITQFKDYYSIKEFAKLIGKSPTTIRRAIKAKRIEAFRIGGTVNASYRIAHSEISRVASIDFEQVIENEVQKRMKERIK